MADLPLRHSTPPEFIPFFLPHVRPNSPLAILHPPPGSFLRQTGRRNNTMSGQGQLWAGSHHHPARECPLVQKQAAASGVCWTPPRRERVVVTTNRVPSIMLSDPDQTTDEQLWVCPWSWGLKGALQPFPPVRISADQIREVRSPVWQQIWQTVKKKTVELWSFRRKKVARLRLKGSVFWWIQLLTANCGWPLTFPSSPVPVSPTLRSAGSGPPSAWWEGLGRPCRSLLWWDQPSPPRPPPFLQLFLSLPPSSSRNKLTTKHSHEQKCKRKNYFLIYVQLCLNIWLLHIVDTMPPFLFIITGFPLAVGWSLDAETLLVSVKHL